MIPALAIALTVAGSAAEIRPFRQGDTIESVAASLGDPGLARAIRDANGVAPGLQPPVGTLLELPAPDVPHADQVGFLLAISGTVTVGGAPATTYTPIPAKVRVCTGDDGFATLRVATQCTDDGLEADDLTLTPGTCLELLSAFATVWSRSAVVRLESGSVVISDGSAAAGNVTVITDAGWTTGSEGGFRVNIEEAAMRTEALYARVAVQGQGVEVALEAAQGSRVEEGAAPSAPVDLLVAKQLYLPAAGQPMRRPLFTWEPGPRAFGYQLEIAADPAFADLVYLIDAPEPRHVPTVLMLPGETRSLWWRVAPFDGFRFLGVPSPPRELVIPTGAAE